MRSKVLSLGKFEMDVFFMKNKHFVQYVSQCWRNTSDFLCLNTQQQILGRVFKSNRKNTPFLKKAIHQGYSPKGFSISPIIEEKVITYYKP